MTPTKVNDGLFALGEIVTTPKARRVLAALGDPDQEAGRILARHHYGDWGDVSAHEREQNNLHIEFGELASAYGHGATRLYVITAADRSNTIIKTPREPI